jgi:DNA-directed RNA polymerase subunit L
MNEETVTLAGYEFTQVSENEIKITCKSKDSSLTLFRDPTDGLAIYVFDMCEEIIKFGPTFNHNVAFMIEEASMKGYKTALDALRKVLDRAEELMTRTQH